MHDDMYFTCWIQELLRTSEGAPHQIGIIHSIEPGKRSSREGKDNTVELRPWNLPTPFSHMVLIKERVLQVSRVHTESAESSPLNYLVQSWIQLSNSLVQKLPLSRVRVP